MRHLLLRRRMLSLCYFNCRFSLPFFPTYSHTPLPHPSPSSPSYPSYPSYPAYSLSLSQPPSLLHLLSHPLIPLIPLLSLFHPLLSLLFSLFILPLLFAFNLQSQKKSRGEEEEKEEGRKGGGRKGGVKERREGKEEGRKGGGKERRREGEKEMRKKEGERGRKERTSIKMGDRPFTKSILTYGRPNGVTFHAPAPQPADQIGTTPIKKGDIVTFMYASYSRNSIPLKPVVCRVRRDKTWTHVVHDFRASIPKKSFLNRMSTSFPLHIHLYFFK
jgi:hypothetical protein